MAIDTTRHALARMGGICHTCGEMVSTTQKEEKMQMAQAPRTLLTLKEAARRLGMTVNALRIRKHRGKLPFALYWDAESDCNKVLESDVEAHISKILKEGIKQ